MTHPVQYDINPPDPVRVSPTVVDYPTDPAFWPVAIPEQLLVPIPEEEG